MTNVEAEPGVTYWVSDGLIDVPNKLKKVVYTEKDLEDWSVLLSTKFTDPLEALRWYLTSSIYGLLKRRTKNTVRIRGIKNRLERFDRKFPEYKL